MTKCDHLPFEYIWTTTNQICQSGAPGGGAAFGDKLTGNTVKSVRFLVGTRRPNM
jgi:hypothetical protein